MRRRVILTSIIVGPLVGSVAAWLVVIVYTFFSPFPPNTFTLLEWLSLLVIAIPVGYVIGLLPSLLAGVVIAALGEGGLGPAGRIVVAGPLGILTTWLVWFWLILEMPSYNVGVVAAMFTAAGAAGCTAAAWWAAPPAPHHIAESACMIRNIWLLVVSLLLGPAIGGLVFYTFATITDGIIAHNSGQGASSFLGDNWPIILIAAYTLGSIPAGLSAIIMMIVARFLSQRWQRLLAGAVIGALVSGTMIGLFLFSDDVNSVDDLIIISGVALTGAVSAFLCVGLIELWHPLPKRQKPVDPSAT